MFTKASAQTRKAGPINRGFVFIDGEYIEPPYTVKRKGMTVYLNDIQIMQEQKVLTKEDFLLPKKEPGIPSELKKEDDIDKMYSYTYENTRHAYISAQRYYYLMNYSYDVAIQKSIKYYESLPNIKETNGSGMLIAITHSGDTGKIMINSGSARDFSKRFGPDGEGLPKRRKYVEYVNQQVQSIGNALKSGKIYFVFNDTSRFDDYARFYLSPHSGKNILRQLNTVCTSDSLNFEQKKTYIKENILKSNQAHPYLDKIINNFGVDEERLKSEVNNTTGHLKKNMDDSNKNGEKSNNKNVNPAYSPQNININIGAPDPWASRYFLHTSFDNLCLKLSELTADQGYANPVYYIDDTNGDDNWGNLTYDNFINFANAGINFWVSHGTEKEVGIENSGYIEVIYANSENALLNWFNGNSQTGFGIWHEDIADNNGWNGTNPVPYVLLAYPEVAQQYWSDDISSNKAITILGTCYSYQNGFVEACGNGGATFGYEENAASSDVISTMNKRLFKRLNGTTLSGGEFIRNTKDAMNDLTSQDGFSMYPSNAVLSLCPSISEKYPDENATVASNVQSGYIKFDTWCDAGQTADNALDFDVQNGDIIVYEKSWEGSDDYSNQINFQWSGTYGEVTVTVNPEYIRAYNGGQRLDYDGVIPNNDPGSYSFTVDDNITFDADFTADNTVIISGQTVNFTNTTNIEDITSYLWEFGDGNTSELENPSHTYNTAGTYDVTLTVTTEWDTYDRIRPNYIHVFDESSGDIECNSTVQSTQDGKTVAFDVFFNGYNDAYHTYKYSFSFGDGQSEEVINNVASASVTHSYDDYGTYNPYVMLRIDNMYEEEVYSGGCACPQINLTDPSPCDDLIADFSIAPDPAPLDPQSNTVSVSFNNQSYGGMHPYHWNWAFLADNYSNNEPAGGTDIETYNEEWGDNGNPDNKTYIAEGEYPVTLTLMDNNGCTDDVTKYVQVFEPEACYYNAKIKSKNSSLLDYSNRIFVPWYQDNSFCELWLYYDFSFNPQCSYVDDETRYKWFVNNELKNDGITDDNNYYNYIRDLQISTEILYPYINSVSLTLNCILEEDEDRTCFDSTSIEVAAINCESFMNTDNFLYLLTLPTFTHPFPFDIDYGFMFENNNWLEFYSGDIHLTGDANDVINNNDVKLTACSEVVLEDGFETGNGNFIAQAGFEIESCNEVSSKLITQDTVNKKSLSINKPSLKVFPNPVGKRFKVKINHPKDGYALIQLLDTQGKLIKTIMDDNKPAGCYAFEVLNFNLKPGMYFCKYITNDISLSEKIIKSQNHEQ
jgi:PKD repeat protein